MVVGTLVRKHQKKAIYAPLVLFDLFIKWKNGRADGEIETEKQDPVCHKTYLRHRPYGILNVYGKTAAQKLINHKTGRR